MGARHSRLAGALSSAWEAEVVSARVMTELAARVSDPRVRSRLTVLAAFCRAHASRVLARLASMGRGPMPVPRLDVELHEDLATALRNEAAAARASALRYEELGKQARATADLSSAWICELNRSEEMDRAEELARLADGEVYGAGPSAEHQSMS